MAFRFCLFSYGETRIARTDYLAAAFTPTSKARQRKHGCVVGAADVIGGLCEFLLKGKPSVTLMHEADPVSVMYPEGLERKRQ